MYDARDVAKWFLGNIDRESGESITHLKLQKLLYYAQAWSLAIIGTPLFHNSIQAWTHGPVVPDVYHDYSDQGWSSIDEPQDTPTFDEQFHDRYEHILFEVYRVYGKYDAKYLEDLTHQELPWKETRGDLPLEARCTKEISLDSMKEFYTAMQNQ